MLVPFNILSDYIPRYQVEGPGGLGSGVNVRAARRRLPATVGSVSFATFGTTRHDPDVVIYVTYLYLTQILPR